MISRTQRTEPLPVDALRDLLGLVRAIYLAALKRGAGRGELQRIERIGRLLKNAIELSDSPPGSIGFSSAWNQAEMATREVGDIISVFERAEPVIAAAVKRIRRT